MKRSALSTGFASDCRGNVAMLYALMLPALIFGAGFAIDYTHAMQVQTKLNAIADSAALVALTPGMMNKTNDVAKAAATNMFTSQAAAIASLDMNRTTVSVTVSNPSNNSLVRTAVVSYAGANRNIFAGILGYSALRVSGVASANASLAANIDFYLLLDNSPSMALPATQSGINSMISHTPQQGNGGGCVFACHQANTGAGNPNTAGNPYWNPNKTSQICTGAPSGKRNDPNVGCEQMDNYQLARSLSIPLRIDEVGSGVTALMATAQQTQAQSPQAPPPAYRFAANAIDASNARGFTNLMALSSNYAPAWAAAASKLQLMQMWDENVECAPSGGDPCGAPGTQSNDTDTDLDAALTSANSQMPNPGNGTSATGDTPQKVLFIITDGVVDETYDGSCSQTLANSGTRCQEPIRTVDCDAIKKRGIRIAVLYTTYLPVPTQSWYQTWIAPFQSKIAANLKACASQNLYYEAKIGDNLGTDLSNLFQAVTQSATLTQ